jgi:2-keto-3-deoxy-L-rhamnonate aldolase RhmA
MRNRFREALVEKQLTVGAWMQMGHPAAAEIFGHLGFDWVCVDMEHGAIGFETMTAVFRAVAAFESVAVARLPMNDPVWIRRTLDAGAGGLIIPMVNSADEARRAVREAKYPPLGRRGYGYSRANLHGLQFHESIGKANEEIALVAQIEHRDGIEALDEILAVEGVDAAFIGPMDLSGSYGKTGQLDDPEVVMALERFRAVCREKGVASGMHVVNTSAANIRKAREQGYSMIALGVDVTYLAEAAGAALATCWETAE